jgi:hypothetical protein
MSDFVMESALVRAEETLADRRVFVLDDEKWTAFQAALDAPVRPMPGMRKLLQDHGYFGPDFASAARHDSQIHASLGSIEEIREAGFGGFRAVSELRDSNCEDVTAKPGVYLVLRPDATPPEFLAIGTGGHFKGKDPNVTVDKLQKKWVENALVLYVGISSKRTLRSRWKERIKFGQGQAVGARGGRYIWQLRNSSDLVVCWKETGEPERAETELLSQFRNLYGGQLPFANLNGGHRTKFVETPEIGVICQPTL